LLNPTKGGDTIASAQNTNDKLNLSYSFWLSVWLSLEFYISANRPDFLGNHLA
jgi:hypothetical protein